MSLFQRNVLFNCQSFSYWGLFPASVVTEQDLSLLHCFARCCQACGKHLPAGCAPASCPACLQGTYWGQGCKAVSGFLRSSYLLLWRKSLVPSCSRMIAMFSHLFHLVGDQVSMLVLLDLSAASSSTDCTDLLPHLQTLLGRDRGALWSLSSPFLISVGSYGQSSSARTVTWYKRCRVLPTPFLFGVRPLGKPLKSCRAQHGLCADDTPAYLSYTLDDAVQCPRECQNEMSKRCQRHHAGQDWAGKSDSKLEEKLEEIAAAPCDDQQSWQQPAGPVSCPCSFWFGIWYSCSFPSFSTPWTAEAHSVHRLA